MSFPDDAAPEIRPSRKLLEEGLSVRIAPHQLGRILLFLAMMVAFLWWRQETQRTDTNMRLDRLDNTMNEVLCALAPHSDRRCAGDIYGGRSRNTERDG